MEILSVQQLIPPPYEPLRQNRWIVEWAGLDAWNIRTFSRPGWDLGEIVLDFINTKRYYQGKFTPQTTEITMTDPIVPSASQKVEEWVRLGHEQATGRAGYKNYYAGKNFKLKMLDGPGAVVQRWDFFNIFPTSVNYGTLDMASPEAMVINATLRWDNCLLQS